MDGLFKVRRKTLSWEKEEIYTVYHVKWFSKKTYELRFLIFRNGKWSYVIADDYEPIEGVSSECVAIAEKINQ